MVKKQKLELTWIGKEERARLEPRILLEDPELSYHAAHRVTKHDSFDNRLIFGDNLLALKALEQEFSGNPGDLLIDSFAGSGTTGAVAHKMGRRWIMVELGEHCHTHIIPRLKKVIDGEDPGGISKVVKWKGGG